MTTESYTIYDLGYNQSLSKIDNFYDEISRVANIVENEVNPINIASGYMSGNYDLVAGHIESNNFVSDSTGWQITADGDVEFNTGTFRGTLEAGSIHIPDQTTANSFHTETDGDSWWGCNVADWASDIENAKAYILKTGVAKFEKVFTVGSATKKLEWDETNLTLTSGIITGGTIRTAVSGQRVEMTSTGMTLYDASGIVGYFNSSEAGAGGVVLDIEKDSSALIANFVNTNSGNTNALQAVGYGTGYVAQFVAQNNVNRTRAIVRIAGISGQGAHLQLEPDAALPASPSEGDISVQTGEGLFYKGSGSMNRLFESKRVVSVGSQVNVASAATSGNSVQMVSTSVGYMVWTDTTNTDIQFSKTTNGGANWSAEAKVDDGKIYYSQNALYAADANNLFVVYKEESTGSLYLAKSTDAGANWTPSLINANYNNINGGAAIGGTDASNLFVIWYYNNVDGGEQDVYFTKSTNGGSSWSTPVHVYDGSNGAGTPAAGIAMSVIDADNIWVAYCYGLESTSRANWKSTSDGGDTWLDRSNVYMQTTGTPISISAVSATEIYATVYSSGSIDLMKSTGGAFSKIADLTNLTGIYAAVYAPSSGIIYVLGEDTNDDLRIEYSKDGGATFKGNVLEALLPGAIETISMHGVGDNYIIAGYTEGGNTNVKLLTGVEMEVLELTNNANISPAIPPTGAYFYTKLGEPYTMDSSGNEVALAP